MALIEGSSYRDTRLRQPPPPAETHRVLPGQTAREIAVQHRTPADRIAAANPQVDDLRNLGGGETLDIPEPADDAPEPLVYTVAQDESIAAIAQRHGTTAQALQDANGLAADEQVPGGEQLLIPADGVQAARDTLETALRPSLETEAARTRYPPDSAPGDRDIAPLADRLVARHAGDPAAPAAVRDTATEVGRDLEAEAADLLAPAQLDANLARIGIPPPADVTTESAAFGGNEVTWTLDEAGRPIEADAVLTDVFSGLPRSRAENDATRAVGNRVRSDDDGGHIIGHRFMGDQGVRNLFPQNSNFNRSAYLRLENEWADWTRQGWDVRIEVSLAPLGAERPDTVTVEYEVVDPETGEAVYDVYNEDNALVFRNEAGQTFDRVSLNDMPRYYG